MDKHTRAAFLVTALACGSASPALAFDCKKAATASEKAICADPAAMATDAAMSQTYAHVMGELPPDRRPTFAAAQARWLHRRDNACGDAKGGNLGACLARATDQRRAFLEGRPESGPGAPGRVAPWSRYEKGGKGRAEIDIELMKFVAPATAAERAFNAATGAFTENLDPPEKGDASPDGYAYQRAMRLTYASPRLISALVSGYQDTGGAHPNSFTAGINIDVAAGREARFDDLADARGAESIVRFCLNAVRAEKKERLADDDPNGADALAQLTKDVGEATRKLDAWSFGEAAATVTYDPYAVGSYAEGSYECVIPYATLRPLAKPGFPLP
jgi:uncharacterized protein